MVEPMPETPEGSLSLDAYQAARKHFKWADVLILGPGLSRTDATQALVWKVFAEFGKPMVIDADALTALAERASLLKRRKNPDIIVTPHTGELSRLTGLSADEIDRERVSVARRVARQLRLTLILKGAPTVTASETGPAIVNSTGNPGMATAGAGDVLAGVVGALWAQGMNRTDAAFAGVFVHGYAGDRAKNELGEKGLMATDIARHIPGSLAEIEGAA
jgi:NAD(P)H-hydrate epimerase